MGDRYHLFDMHCAYCGKRQEEVYYAESSNATTFRCENCHELNDILLNFSAMKHCDLDDEDRPNDR